MKDISVVIPVYKSVESLEILTAELIQVMRDLNQSCEIIFVNDSPQFLPTVQTLESLKRKHRGVVRILEMRKNRGQHFAVLIGLSQSDGNCVITMDDDLQHAPCEIIKLYRALEENERIDAVFAIPDDRRKKHHAFRNFGSWCLSKIDHVFLNLPSHVIKSSFRMIRSDVVKLMVHNYTSFPAISGLLLQMTNRVINVEVEHHERKFGRSHYTLPRLIDLVFNNIVHCSAFPLKILGIIGLTVFVLSNLFILIIIGQKLLFSISTPGWTSIVVLIAFFGGLNLLGMGIIGEYLIRIIKEQRKANIEDLYIET